MEPGKYTELFFLDEATALSAGHRPCNDCRRERLAAFKGAWAAGNLTEPDASVLIAALDKMLSEDRESNDRSKRTFVAGLKHLPSGVMVVRRASPGQSWLLWNGRLHRWSPEGYSDTKATDPEEEVTVLTPRCTVAALTAGYLPEVHFSADVVVPVGGE